MPGTNPLIPHVRPSSPSLIVGLMSGTSVDSIDAVVARISGQGRHTKAHVLEHVHKEFPATLRQHILRCALSGTVAEICELNFVLGEKFARAALAVIRRAGLKVSDITAIGSHGQTIHHLPNARMPATLQIGEPAIIAERTGITTVADFRVADMAAGGQGAPLVPFADWTLFTHDTRPRIVQNIGGIGNLTFLQPRGTLQQVMAFDIGPGNMVLDAVVSKLSAGRQVFDRDGRWAAQGKVSEMLLKSLMSNRFIRRAPPKTTGREEFGEPFVRSLMAQAKRLHVRGANLVATTTAFTAASIADAYHRFILPKIPTLQRRRLQIILGGGGAKNLTLMRMLRERVGFGEILTHEDFGVSNAAKEALAFAILARETLLGRPSNVPSATGAKRPMVLGKILPAGEWTVS